MKYSLSNFNSLNSSLSGFKSNHSQKLKGVTIKRRIRGFQGAQMSYFWKGAPVRARWTAGPARHCVP